LDAWIPRLSALDARARSKLPGVSRSRSRQILAGAIVARVTMKALNVESVDVCPWALCEGIVLHYLQSIQNESFDLPLSPLVGAACGEGRPDQRDDRQLVLAAVTASPRMPASSRAPAPGAGPPRLSGIPGNSAVSDA
jgi:exopolyphosphatase/pppGpp-phosphohydrolase